MDIIRVVCLQYFRRSSGVTDEEIEVRLQKNFEVFFSMLYQINYKNVHVQVPDFYETTFCASHHLDMKVSDNLIMRGWVGQNTTVCVSYLLG